MSMAIEGLTPVLKTQIDRILISLSAPERQLGERIAGQLLNMPGNLDMNAVKRMIQSSPGQGGIQPMALDKLSKGIIAILIGLLLPAVQRAQSGGNTPGIDNVLAKYNAALGILKSASAATGGR